MNINAKKVEIIQHIIIIQKPEMIRKIDRFIHGLDYEEEEYKRVRTPEKKEYKPVNEVRRKIKSVLNLYK